MTSIVERLRQHALPDPHDEREVMHAPLLKEAADRIEHQAERIKELEAYNATRTDEMVAATRRIKELEAELERERMRLAACGSAALGYFDGCKDEYRSASLDDVLRLREQLAALRQRIADAPVVAWEYALCSPNAVLDRQASHVNWDERYQPFGRPGVDYATGAHVQKRPLISKEDLL